MLCVVLVAGSADTSCCPHSCAQPAVSSQALACPAQRCPVQAPDFRSAVSGRDEVDYGSDSSHCHSLQDLSSDSQSDMEDSVESPQGGDMASQEDTEGADTEGGDVPTPLTRVSSSRTGSQRSANRPLLQRQRSVPASPETQPAMASSSNGKLSQESRKKHSGNRLKKVTANGDMVLPHKFRKSRRDPERLRYIYMEQEKSCASCACMSKKDTVGSTLSKFFPCCPNRRKETPDSELTEEDLYLEQDPFRKRCLRAFFNSVYVLLVLIAAVVTYSMVQDLITSMRNPVHSVHFDKVEEYDAPGR